MRFLAVLLDDENWFCSIDECEGAIMGGKERWVGIFFFFFWESSTAGFRLLNYLGVSNDLVSNLSSKAKSYAICSEYREDSEHAFYK